MHSIRPLHLHTRITLLFPPCALPKRCSTLDLRILEAECC
jgi:hypothetical protein